MADFVLIDVLSDDEADERTGKEAIRGFSFQVWWATCHALELLLEKEEDFVVVLEYKEDVAVMDSSVKPATLTFYQVKKNEGVTSTPWSIAGLLATNPNAKKGPSSILGKLFQHRPRFKKAPVSLGFVTNTGFAYGTPKLEYETVEVATLPADIAAKIRQGIANDLKVNEASVDLKGFKLTRTYMPLELQHRWACGILGEVEVQQILPFTIPNKGATAQVLAAEFLARAGTRAFARDFETLLKRGMTRAQLLELLQQHSNVVRISAKKVAEDICNRLSEEGYPYRLLDGMQRQIVRVCVDLSNRNHPTLGRLAQLAARACQDQDLFLGSRLGEDINHIADWLYKSHGQEVSVFEKPYLYLIIALTLKGAHELKSFTVAADSK